MVGFWCYFEGRFVEICPDQDCWPDQVEEWKGDSLGVLGSSVLDVETLRCLFIQVKILNRLLDNHI